MITICFLIPIYLINKTNEKYIITEKLFKYLNYLKDIVQNKATIHFLILGSEKELSKQLTLKYFNENEYTEYDQGAINYLNRTKTFLTILGNKLVHGYNLCKTNEPDLIIFMKNNHFVTQEWLMDVITDYSNSPKSYKIYGLASSGNLWLLSCLNDHNHIDFNMTRIRDQLHLPLNANERFDACLMGIPKILYQKHNMNPNNLTEITIENELMQKGAKRHIMQGYYIFNLKSKNDAFNVTPISALFRQITGRCKNHEISKNNLLNELLKRDIDIINNL